MKKNVQSVSVIMYERLSSFLQILAECSPEQRKFLLMTASPQQMHALVQVIGNVLLKHIPVSEEERRKLIQFKDALFYLANQKCYSDSIFRNECNCTTSL